MLFIRVLVVLIYVKLKSITEIVSYLTRFYVGAKKLLEKAQYFLSISGMHQEALAPCLRNETARRS